MRGFDFVREQSKKLGIPKKHLMAMSLKNDPFHAGAPAQKRDAEWFQSLWQRFNFPRGVHVRRIHYALVSTTTPVTLPDGRVYENRERHFDILSQASKYARHLELVAPDMFSDHRNPEPIIYARYVDRDHEPGWWLEGDVSEWQMPSVRLAEMALQAHLLDMPTIATAGYEYSLLDQPFHLECWIEKSTMDDVLMPVCERAGCNLVRGVGYQSITGVILMLQRLHQLPDDRPTRVFYISDHDPSGEAMPVQVSRLVEFYRERYAPDRDIKIQHIALTTQQVNDLHLPHTPLKDSDRTATGFQERRGVLGGVELDALEGCHPGTLAAILSAAIEPYRDEDLRARLGEAEQEAQESAEDQWAETTREEHDELDGLREQIDAVLERFAPRVREVNERFAAEQRAMNDQLQAELAPLRAQLETLRERVALAVPDLAIESPSAPRQMLIRATKAASCTTPTGRTWINSRPTGCIKTSPRSTSWKKPVNGAASVFTVVAATPGFTTRPVASPPIASGNAGTRGEI